MTVSITLEVTGLVKLLKVLVLSILYIPAFLSVISIES